MIKDKSLWMWTSRQDIINNNPNNERVYQWGNGSYDYQG